jgi:putative ABC transport system permease protein
MSEFFRRLRYLLNRRRFDQELADDMEFHREMAAREGRQNFGSTMRLREDAREAWGWMWIDRLGQDLRFAVRMLRKSPSFTLTAVLTLALGIGANTAVFSLVNSFLLRPLPYPHAERLVKVWEQLRVLGINRFAAPVGDFVDYRKDNHVFEDMAATEDDHFLLTTDQVSQRVFALKVTANIFAMMGLHPALGRSLVDSDNQPGHEHVILLSDAVWRENFGADSRVLRKNVNLDGQTYEVVGVMPRGLRFSIGRPDSPDVWVPLSMAPDPNRNTGRLQIVARLRDGVTLANGQAQMDTLARQMEQQYHIEMGPHGEDPGYGLWVVPLRDELVGNLRESLFLMLCAAGLILLIACANVANLMLAHGVSRDREFAIRISLGASRGRLLRLLTIEAACLAALGGLVGFALAVVLSRLLLLWSPFDVARLLGVTLDFRLLAFASAATFASLLLFGLLPALLMLRRGNSVGMQTRSHHVVGDRAGRKPRQALVISETALSVALVLCAGLLLHSFVLLRQAPLGFDPNQTLTAWIELPTSYQTPVQQSSFYETLLERVKAIPDVQSVATTTMLPVEEQARHNPFSIEGRPWQPTGHDQVSQFANNQAVSTDYFRTLHIPLKHGRSLTAEDRDGTQPVAVINETLVRGFWPNEDPIGKHILMGAPRPGAPWLTIVGVVGDVRSSGANTAPAPELYTPLLQTPSASTALVLRTHTPAPEKLLTQLRSEVAAIDRGVALYAVQTYDDIFAQTLGPRRYEMLLLSSFACLALLLAAIGIYGVISYSVSQRSQEMGLRMAFGATQQDLSKLVLRQALLLSTVGLLLGIALGLASHKLLAAALFGISFIDLPVYAAVVITILAVSLLAAYLPARRAANLDPMTTLRAE